MKGRTRRLSQDPPTRDFQPARVHFIALHALVVQVLTSRFCYVHEDMT